MVVASFRRALDRAAIALVFGIGSMPGTARAQSRPGPALEFAAGWVGFADDGVVSEGMAGGAARFYLSPRIGVGPEVVYIGGDNHRHLVVTGNLTWDVVESATGGPRVVPFLVAGGGFFQTRESFPSGPFNSTDGAFTAGGGARG